MAELTTVARPYAKAAFQYALEKNALAEWSGMLGFAAEVAQNATVAKVLDNPKFTAAQVVEQFCKVCGEQLDTEGRNFVANLAQNKRLTVLPEISGLYEQYRADAEKRVEVILTSAYEITDEQTAKLASALKQRLGREVTVQSSVDKTLIGGLIIRAGDLVIDGSVRGKLAKLADTLNS